MDQQPVPPEATKPVSEGSELIDENMSGHPRRSDYTLLRDTEISSDLNDRRNGGVSPLNEGNFTIQIEEDEKTSDASSEALLASADLLPPEKLKTLFSLIWMLLCMLCTSITTSFVHELVPDRKGNPPLPDIFFKLVERQQWAFKVAEVLGMTLLAMFLSLMLFHKHRFIIMRRGFLLVGLLYLMRCLTMFVTVLPVPDAALPCSDKVGLSNVSAILSRSFLLFSGAGLSITGVHYLCGDYIYSGHTFILIITHMFITEYTPTTPLRYTALHWLTWLMSFSGIVFVLVAREHYTVDVILAYWVATRLFWYYHTVANNKHLQSRTDAKNYSNRQLWFVLLELCERNVKCVVPNEYEVPLIQCLIRAALVLKWPIPFLRRALAGLKFH